MGAVCHTTTYSMCPNTERFTDDATHSSTFKTVIRVANPKFSVRFVSSFIGYRTAPVGRVEYSSDDRVVTVQKAFEAFIIHETK